MVKSPFEPEQIQLSRAGLLDALDGGAVVVTGNARLSRSLAFGHERRMLERGRSAWATPAVLPLTAWLQDRYAEAALLAETPLPRLLSPEQEEQVWAGIIRGDGDALLRADATARGAREAWKLVRQWRIGLSDRRFEDNESTAAARRWMLRFSAHCREREQVSEADLAGLLAPLVSSGVCPLPERLLLVGFYDRTPALHVLLEALRAAGSDVAWVDIVEAAGRPRRLQGNDACHEMELAVRWARGLLEAEPEARIGIVVPDLDARRAALSHLLRKRLAPGSMRPGQPLGPEPWNLSLGRRLSDEPVIATALGLLALTKAPADTAALGRLLMSPHWGLPREAQERRLELGRRALLDARLRAVGESQVLLRTVRFQAGGAKGGVSAAPWASASLAACLDRLMQRYGELPRRAEAGAWAASFVSWLRLAGWPEGRPLDSAEFQAVEGWNQLLSRFSALSDFAGGLTRGGALGLLRRLASETVFQPRSGDVPVQVLGLYEAIGQRFDHAWVMGLHDNAWPAPAGPDPYIPLSLQRELRMPHCDPDWERQWAERVTAQLRALAPEVVFSHPVREGAEALACSPLVANLEEVDATTLAAARDDGWASRIRRSGAPEPLPAHPGLALRQPRMRGGSRLFEHQAACPFRAFAEHRLGARPLDRLPLGLGPLRRGTVVHRALEFLWRELGTQQALLEMGEADLQALVGRCCAGALGVQRRKNPVTLAKRYSDIEAARLGERIMALLEAERRRSPFRAVGFEEPLEFSSGGVQVKIQLDRVDELEDGARVVLDYKTGEVSPSAWFGDRPADPQLPLYGVAASEIPGSAPLAAVAFAQLRADATGFSGVVRAEGVLPDLPVRRKGALRDASENWPGVLEQWKAMLERLGDRFREGAAEVDPRNGLSTCRDTHCELAALCRVHERLPGSGEEVAADDGDRRDG